MGTNYRPPPPSRQVVNAATAVRAADRYFELKRPRDPAETLAAVLKPDSVVVLGGRKRWWPTTEERLARKLRRIGHEVIFTETE